MILYLNINSINILIKQIKFNWVNIFKISIKY